MFSSLTSINFFGCIGNVNWNLEWINWNFAVASPQSGFSSTDSRSNLEMLDCYVWFNPLYVFFMYISLI